MKYLIILFFPILTQAMTLKLIKAPESATDTEYACVVETDSWTCTEVEVEE